jgi:hypothetical protein
VCWLRCWHRARRLFALGQLLAFLPACTSWRVQPTSPSDLLTSQQPSVVRITRADDSRLTLNDPTIHGDTLLGSQLRSDAGGVTERIALPLADVKEIALLRPDPTKNTLLVVGLGVVTFSVLCLADAFGCGPEESFLVD